MRFCNAQIALMFKMIDKKKLNALKFLKPVSRNPPVATFCLSPNKDYARNWTRNKQSVIKSNLTRN